VNFTPPFQGGQRGIFSGPSARCPLQLGSSCKGLKLTPSEPQNSL